MNNNKSLAVINIVGLTPSLLGEHTPNLNRLVNDGYLANLKDVFPAVTCTAQSSMLTGVMPNQHGIVANGWYFRDLAEVFFWRQANQLVQHEKVWDIARQTNSDFTCTKAFWWYNMYANVEYSLTPRPIYPADGRKIMALYSQPAQLHTEVEDKLGPFPMFNFWGPTADERSSQWIADSAKYLSQQFSPSLLLVYLPHLDYNLQRLGPSHPDIYQDVKKIDDIAGELIDDLQSRGSEILVVSEYGIEDATGYIHINKILREHGYLAVRETLGWEMLDCGASKAFAVADHQVAHIYIKDPRDIPAVAKLVKGIEGIDLVLDENGKHQWHLDHERSGELVAMAAPGYWFTYYYWLDDDRAPDFARTVDIHRKPGYDPVELFMDPDMSLRTLKVMAKVIEKKLGFRTLFDFIPLKPELVKGTHGRLANTPEHGPLVIGSNRNFAADNFQMTDIQSLILKHLNN